MDLYDDAMDFGTALIRTGDLDPVYIALTRTGWSRAYLSRWCVAYWCFYHAGLASHLADITNDKLYWRTMLRKAGASGPGAPRASERRHFRGDKALKAVKALSDHSPVALVNAWASSRTFEEVAARVRPFPMFGPWITFKVADMLERVFGAKIDFSGCHLDMYREPREGAALILTGDPKASVTYSELSSLVVTMQYGLNRRRLRPPGLDTRRIGLQEVETVLCKFKGFWKGHYAVGTDIRAIRSATIGWGDAADTFRRNMPEELT